MSDKKQMHEEGTRITEREARENFPEQFKTLRSIQTLDNSEGSVCAWSDCIDGKMLIMKNDSAGNCTIYEHIKCKP